MICVADLSRRARQLEDIGVDLLAVHTGVDQQARGRTPLEDLRVLSGAAERARIAVAGGIDLATASDYIALRPDILIVGSGIVAATDPAHESRGIQRLLHSTSA